MSVFAIPTSDDPSYRQTTTLDGVPYVLTFGYNGREDAWYLSIATPDGTPLATGLKLVANVGLLSKIANAALPPGEIVAWTTSADLSPPGRNELGDGLRCQLYYFDQAEGLR